MLHIQLNHSTFAFGLHVHSQYSPVANVSQFDSKVSIVIKVICKFQRQMYIIKKYFLFILTLKCILNFINISHLSNKTLIIPLLGSYKQCHHNVFYF